MQKIFFVRKNFFLVGKIYLISGVFFVIKHFRIGLRVVGRLDERQVLHILVQSCILQDLSNNLAIGTPPAQRIAETIPVSGLAAQPMSRTADLVR